MEVTLAFPLLVGLIGIALFFDFLNGLHDAANSIATIVSTRVLRPHYAVFWAAFFNFIAFLFFGLHVAETLGTGIINPGIVTPQVIFAALMGAIIWNIVTWMFGIPSSSSHALVGGLVGAGLAKTGLSSIVWSGLLKTAGAIVMSPMIGFFLALVLVLVVSWLLYVRRPLPSIALFVSCNLSRPRSIRLATVAMMRRRRWASLQSCFIRKAISAKVFMCRFGWCSPARRQWRSERFSAAGASSIRWAPRLLASIRCRDFAPKRAAR
ncbi:phosphate/sulfate permease [Rhizobium mongolense]